MATGTEERGANTSWRVMRPVMFCLAALTISYPLGAGGFITLFPGWGVLGLGRALRQPVLRRISIVAVLWSGTTLFSAEVHHDKLVTQLGLYGVVVFFASSALFWLHEAVGLRRESIVVLVGVGWFALNSFHGLLLGYSVNPWKFALVAPTTLICLGFAWRLRAPRVVLIAVLFGIAAVSLLHDARFPAGLSVAVAAATLAHKRGLVTRGSVVRQLGVFAVAVVAMVMLYPPLAMRGDLGQRAQEQQTEISAEGINFLFANRPELVQSAWIAAHHPLLGIGPGSPLTSEESSQTINFLVRLGLPMNINRERYLRGESESQEFAAKGYASHSSALDAVAQGGVLAAPFWILYTFLLVRIVLTRAREDVYAIPAILWLSMFALWDVLFSPIYATQWPELALVIFLASTSASAVTRDSGLDQDDARPSAADDTPRLNFIGGGA